MLRLRRRVVVVVCSVLSVALASSVPVAAASSLQQISSDPYASPAIGQHRTQVEPDTFAWGSTVVAAFQTGRIFGGGATNIGWATSTDGGQTWQHGFLPGTTLNASPAGTYAAASDASVAYDARDGVWLISFLGIRPSAGPTEVVDVLVSRSLDGGLTWQAPNIVVASGTFWDKNWSVCDDTATSPFYGRCYTEFDSATALDEEVMSTSLDGGLTWSPPQGPGPEPDPTSPDNAPSGIGGQPLVQPSGQVVVPFVDLDYNDFRLGVFTSTNGGLTWNPVSVITPIQFHDPAGGLRADIPLPSAEIAADGRIFVAWSDCRFEPGCATSDIVMTSSANGSTWSPVTLIPTDVVGSGVDHFLPGLAVDRASTGSGTRLALSYYFYPNGNCTASTCQLNVGFASSTDAGAHWSGPEQVAGPMSLSWLPATSQGNMVGDYFSTSIAPGGKYAVPAFMVANAPTGSVFDQATYTKLRPLSGGTVAAGGTAIATGPTPVITLPLLIL